MKVLDQIRNASLKNKIFFSITLVILLISVLIALFTRWVLISSLTDELKRRGLGIGQSIAESSRSYILTADIPQLTSLIFDARLGERKNLVFYVFIQDKAGRVLAHTFTRPFPEGLAHANPLPPDQPQRIRRLKLAGTAVYDVALPVREGIYQVGTVHLGMDKNHIDQLIGKLRTTFLGFVSVVTVIFFVISHGLARYITRPISRLTHVSDAISRGDFDIAEAPQTPPRTQDEVRQLTRSFMNMAQRIKASQARLRESEIKYRSLFNSGPNPIFVLERDGGRILDANPRAEAVFGYTRDDLRGKAITDLGPFAMPQETGSSRDAGMVVSKVQYHRRDGRPVHVNIHAIPAHYGDVAAIIVAATDISEMVEKDSQLIQASKMTTLGEMSAGIAHEVNQPLNAIKMGSEFLDFMVASQREIPPADLATVSREISGQVDRAVAIIQRLRDFGRKADLTTNPVAVNDCVQSVLEIIGRQLALQNIRVELRLADALAPVMAHGNRLEQVIFNLLTNARDAIDQRRAQETPVIAPIIRITSRQSDGRVHLTVADTGTGIPAAIKSRIFEAFFTTKKMGEGMGLGLSITSEIVADYGGTVEIGDGIDGGTAFTLTFPAAG